MKKCLISILLAASLLVVSNAVTAQSLPGNSVYQLPLTAHDSNGQPVHWSDLRGKPRVVSMLYTHCTMMCPLIIENAKGLQKQLADGTRSRIGFVMISLDPSRDNAQALRQSRHQHQVPDDWMWLVPDDNDVRALANLLDIKYRVRADGSINHTSVLLLLDSEGRVRARSEVTSAIPDPDFLIQINALLQDR